MDEVRLAAEQRVCVLIDRQLSAAGWVVQRRKDLNLLPRKASPSARPRWLKALTVAGRLPFVFEASGSKTHVTFGYAPEPRARRIFALSRPTTLARLLRDTQPIRSGRPGERKVQALRPLDTAGLRPAQITAIEGVERSLQEQRFDRSLVQMATGAGKPTPRSPPPTGYSSMVA